MGRTLWCYFHKSQPINVVDEYSTFKKIVACLEFLEQKHMALEVVDDRSFCYVSEEQTCVLSPKCGVVKDPTGKQLIVNMKRISRLGFFKERRITHALCNSDCVESLKKHPAMWGAIEDGALILHFFTLAGETSLEDLNKLIKTSERDGKLNWIIDEEIKKDVERSKLFNVHYDGSSFRDLLRYIRNKIAHFSQSPKSFTKRFSSPENLFSISTRIFSKGVTWCFH